MAFRHPELQPGEVFIDNMSPESYQRCGWKTKRRGTKTYDHQGTRFRVRGMRPVFAQESEVYRSERAREAFERERAGA